MIHVSKNELCVVLEKSAVAQGFDRSVGHWLAQGVLNALVQNKPALSWALLALNTAPEPVKVTQVKDRWTCENQQVLIAGPVLADFHRMNLKIIVPDLDSPELFESFLETNDEAPPGPFKIQVRDWQALQSLAAKTYVPASTQSRHGAGACTPDTD